MLVRCTSRSLAFARSIALLSCSMLKSRIMVQVSLRVDLKSVSLAATEGARLGARTRTRKGRNEVENLKRSETERKVARTGWRATMEAKGSRREDFGGSVSGGRSRIYLDGYRG